MVRRLPTRAEGTTTADNIVGVGLGGWVWRGLEGRREPKSKSKIHALRLEREGLCGEEQQYAWRKC